MTSYRPQKARQLGFNGIDYVEVDPDNPRLLRVYFLLQAPADPELSPENIRLAGGARVHPAAKRVTTHRRAPREDDVVVIEFDHAGDKSTYSLSFVATDAHNKPTSSPLPGFDPRYASISFTFAAYCPDADDCDTEDTAPDWQGDDTSTDISYLAKDYGSFRQLMLDRLALIMPLWRERHVPDTWITLVELLAYYGDQLSYYQDAVATEAYLDTSRLRISVRRHLRLIDYLLHEGCNARTFLHVNIGLERYTIAPDELFFTTQVINAFSPAPRAVLSRDVLGLEADTALPSDEYLVFEPVNTALDPQAKLCFYEAHNEIGIYTWDGEFDTIPSGATHVWLRDEWIDPELQPPAPDREQTGRAAKRPRRKSAAADTHIASTPGRRRRKLDHLRVGDLLLLEEVISPDTGNPADADKTHRHIVRLTRVRRLVDPLGNRPVVEVEWAREDALPFTLLLTTTGAPPECALICDVSVARGNIILVDHGYSIPACARLGMVRAAQRDPECEDVEQPAPSQQPPDKFRPVLPVANLTYREPVPADAYASASNCADRTATEDGAWEDASKALASAAALLRQDAHAALPQVNITSRFGKPTEPGFPPPEWCVEDEHAASQRWQIKSDLLSSSPYDLDVVVEIDDQGYPHFRFGDGVNGMLPRTGLEFCACLRVGKGRVGNVGAEAIRCVVLRRQYDPDLPMRVRNPLPAVGGTEPESAAAAKLIAPRAAFAEGYIRRAVTAEDYALLLRQLMPDIFQRTEGFMRWTGSWYEAQVMIDQFVAFEADTTPLSALEGMLQPYRRMGHEVNVLQGQQIAIDVTLTICVAPGYQSAHVKRALRTQLRRYFLPDAWTFGQGVAVSRLIAAAYQVDGVSSVEVNVLQRHFEHPPSVDAITTGFLPMDRLEIVRCDDDPNHPEFGRLTILAEGAA